jgi:hypothetical protein
MHLQKRPRAIAAWPIGWRYSSTGLLSGFFDGVLANQLVVSRLNPTPGYYVALAVTDSTSLGNGNYFSGLIGAYRTYNRTLSNQEILQNYNYERRFFSVLLQGNATTTMNITGLTSLAALAGQDDSAATIPGITFNFFFFVSVHKLDLT